MIVPGAVTIATWTAIRPARPGSGRRPASRRSVRVRKPSPAAVSRADVRAASAFG